MSKIIMKFTIGRLLFLLFFVPTVTSLVISSVYAGRKKFKTFSFATPLLPSIVKVEPNKFHLTFRQNKYMRTPQFKIEGTLPLKAPTIIKELIKPNPYPEVTNINFGDLAAIPEANQHVTYDDTQNQPVYAEAPLVSVGAHWKPEDENPGQPVGRVLPFPKHHRTRRQSDQYINRFMNRPFNDYQSPPAHLQNRPHYPYMQSSPSFTQPTHYHHNYNPSANPFPSSSHQTIGYQTSPTDSMTYPSQQFNSMSHMYASAADMTASPSSYGPPKYENAFNPSNHQNNKWIPIDSHSLPSPSPVISQPQPNFLSNNQKKLNIGEHYNPSASYVDEKMVEKPTYDPDESEPDEGQISFSISGPHGGEEVPVGYESKIKQMHEELKEHPEHLPPGLDAEQLSKYYSHLTFTDALKPSYGYKPAFGPLGFLKSKLKSWKNILA